MSSFIVVHHGLDGSSDWYADVKRCLCRPKPINDNPPCVWVMFDHAQASGNSHIKIIGGSVELFDADMNLIQEFEIPRERNSAAKRGRSTQKGH